jgi:flagellar hook-associated protein 2
MPISSTGIGSGLDVESIVSSLMAVERKPAALLETAATGLKAQLSTYGQLQSNLATFQSTAREVSSVGLWSQTQAVSSDTTAATVSTGSAAAAGNYSLSVESLAASQTATSTPVEASTTSLGTGQLTIDIGSWDGDPATFGVMVGMSTTTIDIGPGESSLSAIRDKINAAGVGVIATVINDATGARLSIRSTASGAANGFRITAAATGAGDDGATLDMLGYDPEHASTGLTLNQAGANAHATLNGVPIESASNTLADVADGLTIKLLKPTDLSAPVNIAVTQDTEAMKTAVTGFVTAYNDLSKFIAEQTKYNAESKVGGKLQGDRTVIGVQNQLRTVLREVSTASGVYGSLSDVGIRVQKDGTLAVTDAKLKDALAKPEELRKMLASSDETTATSSGIAFRFKSLMDQILGSDGSIDSRTEGIKSSITRNSKRQSAIEDRLAQTEKRLRAQYQSLDANMAKLNGLSSYVTTQLNQLNRN